MAKAINYYDEMPIFFGENNEEPNYEKLIEDGVIEDGYYPTTIKEFKKLGYGFSSETIECHENDRTIYYTFDEKEKMILIETGKFTIKECFIIIDMINKQLNYSKAGDFVCFGNDDDENHRLFHEESTVFGMWWEDFYELYLSRMESDDKISRIYIFKEDYDTDDKRYFVKDRVIHIVLE